MSVKEQTTSGRLSIVASPIGNLEDITLRALRVLKEADLIAAEDTRHSRKLLTHYEIKQPLTSYHMHNEKGKTSKLLDRVLRGEHVALLSDAGTPCLSDPGYLLVRDAIAAGIEPEIIPGAAALTYAVSACGFPVSDFHFGGFLPPKGAKRRRRLAEMAASGKTFFLYESPHRINKLLTEIAEELGVDTQVALIREATKFFEEHIRGTAGELCETLKDRKWKGEFTVAVTTHVPRPTPTECSQPPGIAY